MSKGIILAVDDSTDSLRLLVQILTRDGYTVRPADSGQLALASVAAQRPDLILLDIRMPDPDGFAVCRRLKVHTETRNIPIIFLSGETNIDEQVEGLRLGAVDFVRKPVRPDELLARVRNHIELGRLHNQLEETLHVQDIQFRTAWEALEAPMKVAIDAEDWALVARLFEPNAFLKLQQFEACRRLIMRLPDAAIRAEPSLGFWRAYTLGAMGRVADARRAALEVDSRFASAPAPLEQARIKSLLARLVGWQGDYNAAVDYAEQGFQLAQGGPATLLALGHHWLGTALVDAGRPTDAAPHFLAGVSRQEEEQGVRRWLVPLVMCWYGRTLVMQGRLNDAMTVCRNAFAYERQYGGPSVGLNYALEADVLLARNLLDLAQQSIEKAIDSTATSRTWLAMPLPWMIAVSVYYARGEQETADRFADELLAWAKRNDSTSARDHAETQRVLYWLREGNIDSAREWVDKRGLTPDVEITYALEPLLLTLARVDVHVARQTEDVSLARRAVDLCRRLQEAAQAYSRSRDCLRALLVEALALHAAGDVDMALAVLERCMAIAVPESAFRAFVDEGQPMVELLSIALDRGKLPDTTRGLLEMFGPSSVGAIPHKSDSPSAIVNPLTDREFELLSLIADGKSNAELADALFISNNTVKTHIKHLYQKLNAASRSQALDQARSLGLIA